MQLYNRLSSGVSQLFRNDVAEVFDQRPETPQTTTVTSPPTEEVHDLTADSPKLLPLQDITPKFRTRAVPQLIDEDDREHLQDQEIGAERERYRNSTLDPHFTSSPPTSPSTASTRRYTNPSLKRELSSPEERRALGDPEPAPRDAVKIRPPGATGISRVSHPAQMPDYKVPHGFKPLNTLSDVRSHKSQMLRERYPERKMPQLSRVSAKSTSLHNPLTSPRDNNHNIPNKRQRVSQVQSSPVPPRDIISIDSGDEDNTFQKLHYKSRDLTDRSGTSRQDMEILDDQNRNATQTTRSPAKPLRELNLSGIERSARLRAISPPSLASRFDVGAQKTRRDLDAMLNSPAGRTVEKVGSADNTNVASTPSRGVRQTFFDHSPDEIQSECVTIQPSNVRAKTLKKLQQVRNQKHPISLNANEGRTLQMADLEGFKLYRYGLKSLLAFDGASSTEFELVIAPKLRYLWIYLTRSILAEDAIFSLSSDKIIKVDAAENDKKVMMLISANVLSDNKLYIEFRSEKDQAELLLRVQEDFSIALVSRTAEYMEKLFQHRRGRISENSARPKFAPVEQPKLQDLPQSVTESTPSSKADRLRGNRMIDRITSPDSLKVVGSAPPPKVLTRHSSRLNGRNQILAKRSDEMSHTSPYFQRSSADLPKSTTARNDEQLASASKITDLINIPNGKTLTLHGPSKKSESLGHDDFERLNEDEFLNDNLISFFLLYLQKQAAPHQLKRMHFFNTFFYSALTKDAKGRSNINYDAVARWTKNVNLFNRDFVIVPVNESYHWFVMIICNLSTLKEADTDGNVIVVESEHADSTEHDRENKPDANTDLHSPESARESFQELSLDDKSGSHHRSQAANSSRKSRKSTARVHRAKKYDVHKPVIITLDSLDQAHSTTASQLKKYVASLASDTTQNHDSFYVDANSIPGMTAKGMPHQKNFSDCGLYLCMYMEQFIKDPDCFVKKVLQREATGPRWPANITSRELRERLAKFINLLYEEEAQAKDAISPPQLGSILIDMLPAEDEVVEIVSPETLDGFTRNQVERARRKWEDRKVQSQQQVSRTPDPAEQQASNHHRDSDAASPKMAHASHGELPSSTSPSVRAQDASSPKSDQISSLAVNDNSVEIIVADSFEDDDEDSSAVSPTRIAQQRGPFRVLTAREAMIEDNNVRRARSDSVSTDFLISTESYRNSSPDVKHGHSKSSAVQLSPRALRSNVRWSGSQDDEEASFSVATMAIPTDQLEETPSGCRRNRDSLLSHPISDTRKSRSAVDTTYDDDQEEMLV